MCREQLHILSLSGDNVCRVRQNVPLRVHILSSVTNCAGATKCAVTAISCQNKGDETKENLAKATKTLEKITQGYSNFVTLTGKLLWLNTFVFSTIWNNAWLINIKNEHYKKNQS